MTTFLGFTTGFFLAVAIVAGAGLAVMMDLLSDAVEKPNRNKDEDLF